MSMRTRRLVDCKPGTRIRYLDGDKTVRVVDQRTALVRERVVWFVDGGRHIEPGTIEVEVLDPDPVPWIQTWEEHAVDLEAPDGASISIGDIAFALGNICRFTGHVDFYSVAQHSVLVSRVLEEQDEDDDVVLAGLMHDAHEAYVGDVSSPLGRLLPDFKIVAKRLEKAVRARFGLTDFAEAWKRVKQADLVMLATEHRDLMYGFEARPWAQMPRPRDERIVRWPPDEARRIFLEAFKRLGGVA